MKFCLRYYLGMLFTIVLSLQAVAQTHRIDSLKNELKKSPKDSISLFQLIHLGSEYFSYDTAKVYEYLLQGFNLAKKMNWDYALADYYQNIAGLKQYSSQHDLAHLYFDSAIYYYKKSGKIAQSKQASEQIKLAVATCLGQKADILIKKGQSAEAIEIILATLEMWKASDQPRKEEAIGTYYAKIATTYHELKQYEKALEYDKLSLSSYLKTNNEEAIAFGYIYVSDDFITLKQIDSSLYYLEKAKPLLLKLNNHRLNQQYYNKLGQISSLKKEYRLAISYFEKSIAEAKIIASKYYVLSNQRNIGVVYEKLGEYKQARKYLLTALPAATGGNYTREKMEILEALATVEEKTNHPVEALNYLKQAVALRDSVNQENSKKAVAEIETKYQASEKAKEIIQLKVDKQLQAFSLKQKTTFSYVLIGSLVALLLLGFIGYRNSQHRQLLTKQQNALQRQHISELEKDKQLVAVDAMLKGQQEERSRLAKDLHDGLGGLLSGVKFSLSNMKDNLIITPDNMAVFERSLDLIDSSILELRRVAQNMMPEMLSKFGLDVALKEYCGTINATKLLEVKYQSIGMETRIENSSEIIIYRIIQELLNNTMKHAAATEAIVQLVKEENRFNIIVEDNGKGFNTLLIKNNKGAGITNIQSRVDYLKGQLDIHAEPGKGTLVNIEFGI